MANIYPSHLQERRKKTYYLDQQLEQIKQLAHISTQQGPPVNNLNFEKKF